MNAPAAPIPHIDKMYPYQITDTQTMLSQIDERGIAVSHHEQGLGKSLMSISVADVKKYARVLILCPAIGRLSWADEIETWMTVPREVLVIKGSADINKLTKMSVYSIVVCTYDLCRNEKVRNALRKFGFEFAILDEFQQLRNPMAKRTRAAYSIKDGVLVGVKDVLIMSGTPIVSWPLDLWCHLKRFAGHRILLDGKPMTFEQFTSRYHITTRMHVPGKREPIKKIVRARNLEELHASLDGWAIRRKKADVLTDLPPMTFRPWPVEGDARAKKQLLDDLSAELPPALAIALRNAKTDADMANVMRQIASSSTHVAKVQRLTGMAKAAAVVKTLADELSESTYKIGVFAWNIDVINVLAEGLSKYGVSVITGSTNPNHRQQAVETFQNGDKRVFIGNILACGTALTLTAASRVVFVQQSWLPGDNAQAAARFHRIGQRDAVDCRMASLSGTIDDALTRVLANRISATEQIVDTPHG